MSKSILENYFHRQSNQETNECKIIYRYFQDLIIISSAEEVIEKFRQLFIEEKIDKKSPVYLSFQNIITSKKAESKFYLILNQCCQILIDEWCQHPSSYPAIVILVSLFNNFYSSQIIATSSFGYRQIWLFNYTKTKPYLQLKRLASTIYPPPIQLETPKAIAVNSPHCGRELVPDCLNQFPTPLNNNPEILGDLFYRYTFLYKYCLLNQNSTTEYCNAIRHLKSQRRNKFELSLIKYLSYRTKLIQIARSRQFFQGAGKILSRSCNPTLLNEVELNLALKNFIIKVQKINFNQINYYSYQDFKKKLYQYLIDDLVDFKLNEKSFSKLLYAKIQSILPQYDSQQVSEYLLLNICSQIINFLVLEESLANDSSILSNLAANLGATYTVHLLIKIIILCPKVKPYLDKRLASLFERYELFYVSQIDWFIKILENLLIAYSTCLGNLDLSIFKVEFFKESKNQSIRIEYD